MRAISIIGLFILITINVSSQVVLPPYEVKDFNEYSHTLTSLASEEKPILLYYFANWSRDIWRDLDEIQSSIEQWREKEDFVFIPILFTNDYSFSSDVERFRSNEYTFPIYYTKEKLISDYFSIKLIPVYLIFNSQKQLTFTHSGWNIPMDSVILMLQEANSSTETDKFVSNCTGDCLNGYGERVDQKNGYYYKGTWKDGILNGQGEMKNRDGVYSGNFVNGKKEGQGTMIYVGGGSYSGFWKNDLFEGQGKFINAKGEIEEGVFIAGKLSTGKYTASNGSTIPYLNGKITGSCSITYNNGDTYNGDMVDGSRHGYGVYKSSASGKIIKGEFRNDEPYGQMTVIYSNGDKYVGEYSSFNRNGSGTYFFANGDQKSGTWVDGKCTTCPNVNTNYFQIDNSGVPQAPNYIKTGVTVSPGIY